jgi:dolichyl-phosphate-mannose--protein O-mannosyl transferase
MALGMGIFGKDDRGGVGNECWGDDADEAKRNNPNYLYEPFGWRFFGALAGVGAVVFIYFIAKRLFHNEVAALSSMALLAMEGLPFVQSRIGTPDTFVLFFILGTVCFLLHNRFLLSGLFFGLGVATKWNAMFVGVPIVLYMAWRVFRGWQETRGGEPLKPYEYAIPGGLAVLYLGIIITIWRYVATKVDTTFSFTAGMLELAGLAGLVAGGFILLYGFVSLFTVRSQEEDKGTRIFSPRGRVFLEAAVSFGVFFMMLPVYIYMLTYIPMLANGHDLSDVRDLNRLAYDFHSSLTSPHGYSSPWDTWPILGRPIYLYVQSYGSDVAKIYSMGNFLIFWAGLPALAFVLWQGIRFVQARIEPGTGALSVFARFMPGQPALLFVVLCYLGFWLPWALNPRILFLYHYLPALPFLVLALGYSISYIWNRDPPWGRALAMTFLVAVAAVFIWYYPHFAAVRVSSEVDETYYEIGDRLPVLNWR